MNDEVPTGVWVGIALIWAALLTAFLWTQSWERVFYGVAVLIGLALLAGILFILFSFIFTVADEYCLAGAWLKKLDGRIDELEKEIKLNSHRIGHCHDSSRRVEAVLTELREAVKQDSKEMAKGSVNDAAEEILESL